VSTPNHIAPLHPPVEQPGGGRHEPAAPQGARPASFGLLLKLLARFRWQVAVALGAGLVVSAGPVPGLRLVEEISRTLVGSPGHLPLGWLGLAVVGLAAVLGVTAWLQHLVSARIGLRLASDLRIAALGRVLALPWGWLQRQRIGELTTRLGHDVLLVQQGVERLLPRLLRLVLLPVAVLAYLLYLSWSLTLITLVLVLLGGGAMALLGRATRQRARESARDYDALNTSLQETLQNRYTIKCLGTEAFEEQRLRAADARHRQGQAARVAVEALYRPLTALLQLACLLGLLLSGGHLVQSGELDLSQLTAYFAGLGTLLGNFSALGGLHGELQQAIVSWERLRELLELRVAGPPALMNRSLPRRVGAIRFECVSFRHPGNEAPGLRDIDLEIAAGEMVAIVGPSGAGKTTLLNLLLRLYAPERGHILIGGIDIAEVDRSSLCANIGIVPQQPELFSGAVRENIAYAWPQASDASIRQAARWAQAEEFIQRLPQGYDTRLDESGGNLSAGERQRLVIARALLRDPPILLLDEPTANLDAHSEAAISLTLQQLRRGRTLVLVAHRLATAQTADRILVLEEGRITESGAPSDLLKRAGPYQRLYLRHLGLA